MAFKDIDNNGFLIKTLTAQARSGRVHHAYIFEGPYAADKESIAVSFAQALLCEEKPGEGCGECPTCRKIANRNHLDVKFLKATSAEAETAAASVRDKEMETLLGELKKRPIEADRNIAIINDADHITPRAQDHLLKTLEEPIPGTVFMLLSENAYNLEITVRSRCMHMRCLSDDNKSSDFAGEAAETVKMLAKRHEYVKIRKVIEDIGKDRRAAEGFLDELVEAYRECLISGDSGIKREQIYRAVSEIETARRKLRGKVSVQYALKSMALDIGG